MARSYALDTQAAKEANTGGKRITETGKYTGTIIAAFYEQNARGTESVNIMFAADNGQECGPLNLYTHNGNGEPLAGYKMLNALMTCAKTKSLTWRVEPLDLYDYDEQKVVTKQKECCVELKGKQIGLILQQEEYEKSAGGIGERMVIAAPFEFGTELMAAEILAGQKQPAALGNYMAFIAKNPVRRLRKNGQQQAPQRQQADHGSDYFDDDIPF
ncbi:hypothetical protein QK383_10360 [Pseudomonas aeruginosa]|uniref:hypothetical protein n=1 Tax=Pseudomonas aeruginosa group TaxID=136841 RepID=UPI001CA49B02|nr:hypothetical protein [Pseudomonas aeruginosa]MBW6333082.1 hypothetical protein [Pseudomonas aeruginosa]MCM8592255.1 hypothetical protein [Pseudomonas aeruginosa]MCM8676166.1 hypothetical protein [Pseudomonas aeruginosa]MCP2656113.1 hypothetical protein [Pseudomonas aeruginosa]MDI3856360.1 hypothetical protein [Pseudomonas aeruginosa]